MARKRAKADATETPVTTVVVMCLYVAGRAPNSVKAIANLEAICRRHLMDGYKLEIVDVCEHPLRALSDGVLVTPSLAKVSPAPTSNGRRAMSAERSPCSTSARRSDAGLSGTCFADCAEPAATPFALPRLR